ncbi:MAG TPA: class 1 isoprenoid biosynthesis enzyme [Nonomuraea sp.]|nr:class 1 isoprenoid biosynthesis enzyme [Nonomuraea sp.]
MVLVRSMPLATGLPATAAFAYRTLGELADAYDRIVAPLVAGTVGDPAERRRVDRALRGMSVKIGYAVLGYARMAGRGRPVELAALAGAATRLYDDLMDGAVDERVGDRLGDLFRAQPFAPAGDLERLLAELCYQIARRLHPLPDAAPLAALNELHDYQCLSRRQREPDLPLDLLEKITRGKGAMANLTLCSLVKPRLDDGERELVMALGEALQSLDDYMDVERDRDAGVRTLASLGSMTLADVAGRLRALRPRLVAAYGRAPARRYCGMIYFLLLKSVAGRRLPVVGRLARRLASRSTVLMAFTRGDDALPPARARARPDAGAEAGAEARVEGGRS